MRRVGEMSLAHALMTALAELPCSGSELARRFDRSIGYFWPATHQQIYRELARLESQGLVASSLVSSSPGRMRRYELMPAGRAELLRWVSEPLDPRPIRDDLLIKFRAEAVLGGGSVQEAVTLRLERHRAKLVTYREIEARFFMDAEPERDQRLRRLILEAGIRLELLWIGICEEALVILLEPQS